MGAHLGPGLRDRPGARVFGGVGCSLPSSSPMGRGGCFSALAFLVWGRVFGMV